EFSKKGGRILYLDQINKYKGWSQELKRCHDEIPGLKIVFTASPVLRVADENPDLHGIARVYHLAGLSFREFLNFKANENIPVYTLSEVLENHVSIARSIVAKVKPLAYFEDYLRYGYYPYFKDSLPFYSNTLLKNINLTLEIDIPYINQIELKYLPKLRKLMYIIASETPFSPNVSRLADEIETSRATVMNYLKYLRNARLIHLLYNNGDDEEAKKPGKVYLNNTNLLFAVSPVNTRQLNLRHTFFYNQLDEKHEVKSSAEADFLIDGKFDFFVGGRKTEAPQEKYAAADVIEIGDGNIIPLWMFGFLY
ncbi:MAG: AAA family ATPase, partial [Prolixibacteraceae bacterium]|nr:AAA family ATPase [Prolixibacteraceae bacterium]